jgi:hypothetical protein
MANFPSDSPLKLTEEQERHIGTLYHDQIGEYLKGLMVEQGLVKRDNDPSILIPIAQPTILTKKFTLNGREYTVEGETEAQLVNAETNIYRSVLNAPEPEETATQARDANGRFVAATPEEEHVEQVLQENELRLKMQRGEISVSDYISQTHALDSYMKENYGIDREAVAGKRFEQEWVDATREWLQGDGKSWIGGEENSRRAQEIIAENNLENGFDGNGDKKAVLTAVHRYMIENNLLVTPPELKHQRDIQNANSPEELRSAAHRALGIPEGPVDGGWTFDRR